MQCILANCTPLKLWGWVVMMALSQDSMLKGCRSQHILISNPIWKHKNLLDLTAVPARFTASLRAGALTAGFK
jgi:hypothetical protein